ncbi:hypothetical protein KCU67_g6002, partial [Aureobasidium melanogenum]
MAEVGSYHVMGVMTSDMTSDMTSQMAVNVPVAGPRVSDEICHRRSPRESGLRREDAVAADIVHRRAV